MADSVPFGWRAPPGGIPVLPLDPYPLAAAVPSDDGSMPRGVGQGVADFTSGLLGGVAHSVWSGLTLPGDVATGRAPMGLPSQMEDLTRVAELAGLAMTGVGAGAGAKAGEASLGSGPVRRTLGLPMDDASRMARADAAGFRRGMPLEYGTAPADERVAAAAIKADDRVFVGRTHMDAIGTAERELGRPFEDMTLAPIADGFVTDSGRYVSRWEAADIARRMGQGERTDAFGATRGLGSEELKPSPAAPSVPADRTEVASTLPGLPGGSGVWGSLAPAEAPAGPSASLWHRTDHPVRSDARGAKDHEIQATLADAWDRGHDAVLLQNYTRPGASTPESIVVVRDQSQLRSPYAAFDPARRNERDIMASMALVLPAGGAAAIAGSTRDQQAPFPLAPHR